jgi:hypothetical protein
MTTIHEHLEIIKEARKEYNTLVQQTSVLWPDLLFSFIADKTKDIPNFLRLEWVQYTPSFNDGDACEFNVCDPEIYVLDPDEEVTNNLSDLEGIEGDYLEFKDVINDIYNVMNEDLMLAAFGDGYKVSYIKGATEFHITESDYY